MIELRNLTKKFGQKLQLMTCLCDRPGVVTGFWPQRCWQVNDNENDSGLLSPPVEKCSSMVSITKGFLIPSRK